MFDAIFTIIPSVFLWTKKIHMEGLPLLFFIFSFGWYTGLFPEKTYNWSNIEYINIIKIVTITDIFQSMIHMATHYGLLGKKIYYSHMIHHEAKDPEPCDAFRTGYLDSTIQLILPLYSSILIVKPNRTTLILFGLLFSQWLLYIHSKLPDYFPKLFVSPSYHRKHHENPRINFSSVFALI
ncbi:MAG: hypothetical protein CBD97_01920 [Pelagibacteraceae bacterium TMED237]|nr:MAG: hypothetical protein CBD97_01920 [Pelagibacteraceae bacterium TMED237]|tara:strand:- start:9131 stop:9673 length:543 start_codon:yes stop_codon:yes gene_type:complete